MIRKLRKVLDLNTSLPIENPNIGARKVTTFLTELLKDDRSVKRSRRSRCIWTTKSKFSRNGWFDAECKAQKRLLNNAKKRFVNSPHNHSLQTAYFKTQSDYKRMTKNKKELARQRFHQLLMNTQKNNPRDFWKYISKAKVQRPSKQVLTPQRLFKSLNEEECYGSTLFAGTPLSYVPELDNEITDDEVTQAILGMKANKVPGIDGIPAEVYKLLDNSFISLL